MLKCHFCNSRVNSALPYNRKRENCISLGLPHEQLSTSCWIHKFDSSAANIITAVPITFNSGKKSSQVIKKEFAWPKLSY